MSPVNFRLKSQGKSMMPQVVPRLSLGVSSLRLGTWALQLPCGTTQRLERPLLTALPGLFWKKVWQTQSLGTKILGFNWVNYTKKIKESKTNVSARNPWFVEGRTADELPTASGVSFRLLSDEANVIQDDCSQEIGKMVPFCSSGVFSGVWWWLWGHPRKQPPWKWWQGEHRDGAAWIHQSTRTASIFIPA